MIVVVVAAAAGAFAVVVVVAVRQLLQLPSVVGGCTTTGRGRGCAHRNSTAQTCSFLATGRRCS